VSKKDHADYDEYVSDNRTHMGGDVGCSIYGDYWGIVPRDIRQEYAKSHIDDFLAMPRRGIECSLVQNRDDSACAVL
jgi:hypothetical protein